MKPRRNLRWQEMDKGGQPVTDVEHELIYGLKDFDKMMDYMNWRLVRATLHAVRVGIPVSELVQF